MNGTGSFIMPIFYYVIVSLEESHRAPAKNKPYMYEPSFGAANFYLSTSTTLNLKARVSIGTLVLRAYVCKIAVNKP